VDNVDVLDQFDRGTQWAASKIPRAAEQLERRTPCTEWNVRALLKHMMDSQRYFASKARGEQASLPNPSPPELIGDDPVTAYESCRQATLRAFRAPGMLEKLGPMLGIAFTDQLIHGWDLATATGQDATMPDDLARAAFAAIDGRLTDDQRGSAFQPPIAVGDDATAQVKLLAYSGRRP